MRTILIAGLLAAIVIVSGVQSSSAAKLNSWNGETASITLTNSELKDVRSDGILGPGKKTYSLVEKNIVKLLNDPQITAALKKKKLKPETYFDTKRSFFFVPIYPAKYKDRIAWDVWIHAQAADKKFCFIRQPLKALCINADPSPGTIGFNEWFVTDVGGNID